MINTPPVTCTTHTWGDKQQLGLLGWSKSQVFTLLFATRQRHPKTLTLGVGWGVGTLLLQLIDFGEKVWWTLKLYKIYINSNKKWPILIIPLNYNWQVKLKFLKPCKGSLNCKMTGNWIGESYSLIYIYIQAHFKRAILADLPLSNNHLT